MLMASLQFSISVRPVPKLPNPSKVRAFSTILFNPKCVSRPFPTFYCFRTQIASTSTSSTTTVAEEEEEEEETISISNLHCFIDLNLGKWSGTFFQFDAYGNLLQKVDTKLAASSYGEDELISLIQTLYIKQPLSNTSNHRHENEPEWAEYKIKESNMFTVDKYQQIGFFPSERAFSLRYQTAGMLETVLREGVLGEDDTGEESPRNLKLPSRRPSIVCENCLYSIEKDMRARAFHIMDPKGVLEMFLIFLEERGNDPVFHLLENSTFSDMTNRITPFLGKWKGRSVTKRSGVYGATIAEADTIVSLETDDNGHLIQDVNSTSKGEGGEIIATNVHWTGTRSENLVTFDRGYQMTLLPGGMYMGCPCDVAKSVKEFNSFHLEFCWLETPNKRQRLVRTYDKEGLAVSSTYFSEIKM